LTNKKNEHIKYGNPKHSNKQKEDTTQYTTKKNQLNPIIASFLDKIESNRRNAKSPRKRINTSNKQHSRKLLQNNPTKMSKKNIQNTKRTKKKNTRTTNTMDTQKHTKPKHTTQLPNHIQLKKKQPQIQQQLLLIFYSCLN